MLEPGQVFASRYRVQRCIAEGGMGAIFEAEHTGTERRVALKLLFPHIMSVASARQKFELEAKISARVNSPFIVQVLDAGYDEASQSPYLVMELLAGQTLAARVREQGPFEVGEALRVLGQVAAGLDAAHGYREAGGAVKPIVHRDLKPENLFLAREHDGSVVAKILDYGIAKVLGDTSNLSQEVRGTPLYMAYEQVTAEALSPQTDVWAYGLIAHFMLTGAHYWRASHRPDTNIQALFAEILSLPLDAPSLRLREQNVPVELSPAFDSWLLQCIDRNPKRRFVSAGAALEALGRVYERGPRALSKPAPAPAPVHSDKTKTYVAPPPAKSPTVGSFAALASERRSWPARGPRLSAATWAYAIGIGAVLVLGAGVWLVVGDRSPVSSSASGGSIGASGSPGAASGQHGVTSAGASGTASAVDGERAGAPRIRVAPIEDDAPPDTNATPPPASASAPAGGLSTGPSTSPSAAAPSAANPPAGSPSASPAAAATKPAGANAAAASPLAKGPAGPSATPPATVSPPSSASASSHSAPAPIVARLPSSPSPSPAPTKPAPPSRRGSEAYKTR